METREKRVMPLFFECEYKTNHTKTLQLSLILSKSEELMILLWNNQVFNLSEKRNWYPSRAL
jgi:hypothetical protein